MTDTIQSLRAELKLLQRQLRLLDQLTAGDIEPTGNEPESICQIFERFMTLRLQLSGKTQPCPDCEARARETAPSEVVEAIEKLLELAPPTRIRGCTMCHDSTWDHECNDEEIPNSRHELVLPAIALLRRAPSRRAKTTLSEAEIEAQVHLVIRDVAELSDRDSPEDWPEAMLVTGDELRDIVLYRFGDLLRSAPSPSADGELLRAAEEFEPGSDHASECHGDQGCVCGKERLRAAIEAAKAGGSA